jgi:hypothetical protein
MGAEHTGADTGNSEWWAETNFAHCLRVLGSKGDGSDGAMAVQTCRDIRDPEIMHVGYGSQLAVSSDMPDDGSASVEV